MGTMIFLAIILGYEAKQLYAMYICTELYKQYAIEYSGIDLSCYMIRQCF